MEINNQTIFCIGDSHVNLFSGKSKMQPVSPGAHDDIIPIFKTFRLGETLAYNLSKKHSRSLGKEKLFSLIKQIPTGSKIMLVAGEIDCRAHLLKQAKIQKRDIKDVVFECVDRYFSVIISLHKLGYEMIIWNLPPSTKFNMEYQEYPTYGTCLERNHATKILIKD